MKKIFKIAVLLGVFSSALFAEAYFAPSEWQFKRTLSVPKGEEFVKVILPNDISSASVNFRDIRIVDQNSGEAPFLISRNIGVSGGSVKAKILNKVNVSGNTQFVLDSTAEGVVHTGINLDIPHANFKRQVSIYSSNTLLPVESGAWNLITKNGYIFKFTDSVTGFTSGKSDVSFSPNTSRYFKVVIAPGEGEWLDIYGATIFGDISVSNPVYTKTVSTSVFNNPEKRATEVVIDLGKEGFLTHAAILQTPSKNFNRKVLVEVSNNQNNWSLVSQGYISSVSTELFEGSSTRLSYPEQTARYIRLSIVNDDNKPIEISGSATLEGPVISAIFKAENSANYILYYGNKNATTPQYDISRISSYIEENKLGLATVGEEVLNPDYVAPVGPVVPFTEKNKFLLNILLVVVVVLFGLGIVVYLRKMVKEKGVNAGEGFEK